MQGINGLTKYYWCNYCSNRGLFPSNTDPQEALNAIYAARSLALVPLAWFQLGLSNDRGGWAMECAEDFWVLHATPKGVDDNKAKRERPQPEHKNMTHLRNIVDYDSLEIAYEQIASCLSV
jgi:hypothetical protein